MALKLKHGLFFSILILFFAIQAQAQTNSLPDGSPIKVAAPHLPLMARYSGVGQEHHGEKFSYNSDANINALKDWAKNNPNEVTAYKVAIEYYLKGAESATLSAADKDIYYDLKAQWYMYIQIVN